MIIMIVVPRTYLIGPQILETDHDSDGCNDQLEDEDDDNDGMKDAIDQCPLGDLGWISTPKLTSITMVVKIRKKIMMMMEME